MITQARLKKLLNYNPETGMFTWIKRAANRIHIGDIAGYMRDGYIVIRVGNFDHGAHRLAWLYMTGEWPEQIDHISHVKSDNKWCNLRKVSHAENQRNAPLRRDNVSGSAGVYWNKKDKKWRASIGDNGKKIYLGNFDKKEDAETTRKAAEIKYGYHENHGK